MSKLDLLTAEESAQAKMLGWELCEIYDLATGAFRVQVWPTDKMNLVVSLAKGHDKTALKALRLCAHGHQRKK